MGNEQRQNISLGILIMLLTTIVITVNDSLYKWVRVEYETPVSYIMFARYSGVFLLAVLWQIYQRKDFYSAFYTKKLKWHLLRSTALLCSTICATFALQFTPISSLYCTHTIFAYFCDYFAAIFP